MKQFRILLTSVLLLMAGAVSAADGCQHGGKYTDYVNPWIGTGGHGHVFLGANVPFGFVQLGPTEHNQGWDWCSGYHIRILYSWALVIHI